MQTDIQDAAPLSMWSLAIERLAVSIVRFLFRYWVIIVPLLFYWAIWLKMIGITPLYDGNMYFDCIKEASRTNLSVASLSCFEHPTFLFFLPYVLVFKWSGGSPIFFNLLTLMLGSFATIAMYASVKHLFPTEKKVIWMLMVLLFAVHPEMLGIAFNFSPDIGVMYFSVMLFALLQYRRIWPAVFAGLFMVYAKETGALVYAIIAGAYLVIFVGRKTTARREKWKEAVRSSPLLIPLIAFAGSNLSGKYMTTRLGSNLELNMFQFNLIDHHFQTMLANLFLINFLWVSTIIIAWAAAKYAIKFVIRETEFLSEAELSKAAYIVVLALAAVYGLTRYVPYNNVRYLNSVYPLLLLLFFLSLRYVVKLAAVRIAILVVVVNLSAASIFTTVDPVSKWFYGTFRFGNREILSMSSAARDGCCGLGRDQLFYNLEFIRGIHEMQKQAMQWVKPTNETVIVGTPEAWMQYGLDPKSYARSAGLERIIPTYVEGAGTLFTWEKLPEKVYFVHYPNFDNTQDFSRLLSAYDVTQDDILEKDDYQLRVSKLQLKSALVAASM